LSDFHDHAHVIAPPALLAIALLAAGIVLHVLWPVPFLPQSLSRTSGLALLVLSPLPGLSALLLMRRVRTSSMPGVPTSALVITGPFRYSRNPMYLTFALFHAGLAVFFNSLSLALMLPLLVVILSRGVIEREEAYLTRLFGDDYQRYRAHVRRWL